jgi:hypothetical protein
MGIGAAIGGIVGGIGQASAAKKAARAQTDAANRQIDFQKEIYADQTAKFKPFLDSGTNALAGYQFEMGLGPRPEGYGGFQTTPGYDFRKQQGIDAIDASAAARGGLMSGRTLQDLTTFGDGLASQEYGNFMQRLAGMTDMGMGAAGMQATAGNNAAAGVGNALANIGNAQAAGAIGQGNALAGMMNNVSGAFGYMNKPGGGGINVGGPGSLFGGNSWGA